MPPSVSFAVMLFKKEKRNAGTIATLRDNLEAVLTRTAICDLV